MSLDKPIKFFIKNREDFVKKHHGEFVIIYENKVCGFYKNELEAYTSAKNKYPSGSFLIRQCLRPEEEETPTFHSRVAS